jgi:hypothetical protein
MGIAKTTSNSRVPRIFLSGIRVEDEKVEHVVWTEAPDGGCRSDYLLMMSFFELEIKPNVNKGSKCGQDCLLKLGL